MVGIVIVVGVITVVAMTDLMFVVAPAQPTPYVPAYEEEVEHNEDDVE